MRAKIDLGAVLISCALFPLLVSADSKEFSPYLEPGTPDRVFWGDTHLHTSNSPDAGLIGNILDIDVAYRFARGEEVESSTGLRVKLKTPLDFLVVSDHAEYIGLAPMLRSGDPILLAEPTGKRWYDMFKAGGESAYSAFSEVVDAVVKGEMLINNKDVVRTVWEGNNAMADEFNDPGRFTAFIGYEWSSLPNGNNLHRVVIFADDATRADTVVPFSSIDSANVEDLWAAMGDYEAKTGGRILAIPHNGNLSNGTMFSDRTLSGAPIGEAYAKLRMRWEPLYEVTQVKGDSETHPKLSPEDEFADFETWDKGMLHVRKEDWMLKHEYARSALKLGLELEREVGVNPFQFGMIGSTDSHTSLSTSREDNYFGKFSANEPAAGRFENYVIRSPTDESLSSYGIEEVASGLAAIWAEENTRESLFDAMKRREVYATTGSRITVRVFGGWEFTSLDASRPDFSEHGYRGGVPMGGVLKRAQTGQSPRFIIQALRDPNNANLDRVQIVKGWVDEGGTSHERVFDVACSDGRAIADRRCEVPVGSSVDAKTASYHNSIGDDALAAHWVDPDFDPALSAFYYVRVIEIPKPRWSTYDGVRFGVDLPEGTPVAVQDRAYTSPIWYMP